MDWVKSSSMYRCRCVSGRSLYAIRASLFTARAWSWKGVSSLRSSLCKREHASGAVMPKPARKATKIPSTLGLCPYGLASPVKALRSFVKATRGGHRVMSQVSWNSEANYSTSSMPVKVGILSRYLYVSSPG